MICNNCLHTKTQVTNSRTHKKTPQVWRRRHCNNCNHSFTTYERVAIFDEILVRKDDSEPTPFNPGILLLDLSESLAHSSPQAAHNAYWLTRSIEDDIIIVGGEITTKILKAKSHAALSRFDTLAGMQYALKHQLFDKIKRPRPRS
jgi:transcriptional repressor NrdR